MCLNKELGMRNKEDTEDIEKKGCQMERFQLLEGIAACRKTWYVWQDFLVLLVYVFGYLIILWLIEKSLNLLNEFEWKQQFEQRDIALAWLISFIPKTLQIFRNMKFLSPSKIYLFECFQSFFYVYSLTRKNNNASDTVVEANSIKSFFRNPLADSKLESWNPF